GMDRQTLRDWVIRYNEYGVDGLCDRWNGGPPPLLTVGEQGGLVARGFAGPDPGEGGFLGFTRGGLRGVVEKKFCEGSDPTSDGGDTRASGLGGAKGAR